MSMRWSPTTAARRGAKRSSLEPTSAPSTAASQSRASASTACRCCGRRPAGSRFLRMCRTRRATSPRAAHSASPLRRICPPPSPCCPSSTSSPGCRSRTIIKGIVREARAGLPAGSAGQGRRRESLSILRYGRASALTEGQPSRYVLPEDPPWRGSATSPDAASRGPAMTPSSAPCARSAAPRFRALCGELFGPSCPSCRCCPVRTRPAARASPGATIRRSRTGGRWPSRPLRELGLQPREALVRSGRLRPAPVGPQRALDVIAQATRRRGPSGGARLVLY